MKSSKSNLNGLFEVKNITNDSVDIYFYGDIVSDYWSSFNDTDQYPEQIISILNEIGDKNLNIFINSGGGNLFAGLAIYNMLKRHKGQKTVYIDAVAGSIASVIAMCGDRIICPSNSYLMIHKPLLDVRGNANDLREIADTLDVLEESILNVYQTKLLEGVDIETIKELVNAETWLNGIEASKYFDIELANEVKIVAKCESEYLNKFTKLPTKLVENQIELEKEKLLLELELM